MLKLASVVSIACLYVAGASAWGASGHETIGYIAMNFLAPKALSFVQSSLGSTYSSSLGPAATWADDVKSETAYKWSADLHYVDAEDNPPTSCSVSETRDCGNGQCILTAIANYTTRVVDTTLSAAQRQEALKFLAYEVGGNDIDVKCSGSSTNLHALLAANYSSSVTTWASSLTTRIKSGDFKSQAASWISCSSTTETLSRRGIEDDISDILGRRAITPLACPLVWAQDANAFDCSFVFTYSQYSDVCTSAYYTGAVPIIELQMARQAYRLAAWLNVLFDGSVSLP
ncbi:hypothetical protein H0H93_013073 [Arthromyces matolae]|nr:hypothetical protein H0H93_013073 [Arthromyces matolae]